MIEKKTADYDGLLKKAARFCAYRERSAAEVRTKLLSLGASDDNVAKVIVELKKQGFIDDARFAGMFARGKFTINGWGRLKIAKALKSKGITRQEIEAAVANIDETEYRDKLFAILEKKSIDMKEAGFLKKKQKLVNFALQRGFETELILDVVEKIAGKEEKNRIR